MQIFLDLSVRSVAAFGLSMVCFLATDVRTAKAQAADGFSIMTWNVEWFYDENKGDNYSDLSKKQSAPNRADWDWKRDAVAEGIAGVAPTVVALQEVEGRRVLWYLTRALERNHQLNYREYCIQGTDHFTEQDVGLLVRDDADVVSVTQLHQTKSMMETDQFYNLSKHLLATVEVRVGNSTEQVHVLVVHLRARAEVEDLRIRQARLAHLWMAERIRRGEHVIVLGDLNTEEDGVTTRPGSDVAALCGYETRTTDDDLVDLHSRLPANQRRTHLLPGKQFDRILVSRSLVEDTPGEPDLVFDSVEVPARLNIRGGLDSQQEHWDNYWSMDKNERDVSDHLPVLAKFKVQ